MKQYYEIEKRELLKLLESAHRLAALRQGGVDNWEGYEYSVERYLGNAPDFASLARKELRHYYEPI